MSIHIALIFLRDPVHICRIISALVSVLRLRVASTYIHHSITRLTYLGTLEYLTYLPSWVPTAMHATANKRTGWDKAEWLSATSLISDYDSNCDTDSSSAKFSLHHGQINATRISGYNRCLFAEETIATSCAIPSLGNIQPNTRHIHDPASLNFHNDVTPTTSLPVGSYMSIASSSKPVSGEHLARLASNRRTTTSSRGSDCLLSSQAQAKRALGVTAIASNLPFQSASNLHGAHSEFTLDEISPVSLKAPNFYTASNFGSQMGSQENIERGFYETGLIGGSYDDWILAGLPARNTSTYFTTTVDNNITSFSRTEPLSFLPAPNFDTSIQETLYEPLSQIESVQNTESFDSGPAGMLSLDGWENPNIFGLFKHGL